MSWPEAESGSARPISPSEIDKDAAVVFPGPVLANILSQGDQDAEGLLYGTASVTSTRILHDSTGNDDAHFNAMGSNGNGDGGDGEEQTRTTYGGIRRIAVPRLPGAFPVY